MAAGMVSGVLVAPAAAATTTSAKSKPAVNVTTPKASPRNFEGDCPTRVSFSSKVKLKLKGKTKVKYRWVYSNGSKSKVRSFTAKGKGTKSYTLRTSAKFSQDTEGWYALQVVSPRKITSKRGYYSVTCDAPGDPDVGPDRVDARVTADQGSWSGPCTSSQPNLGFTGRIRVHGDPEWVHYRWIRNGDVVDTGSVRADDWTTVKYAYKPDRTEKGWVALQVDHPDYRRVASGRAYYSVKCEGSTGDVSASVNAPAAHTGACPATRTFTGSITHRGSGTVRYQWVGDNYAGPVRELHFSGWGSETKAVADESVSTSGDVWRKLRIHSPKYTESNAATAKVNCTTPSPSPSPSTTSSPA
ncbi:hypothetical protein SAMN05421505_112194 [Sinosporangium album]|uniref:Ig-like domain-containing protein n=1 Tax=Sinosporangium album TaxID=504805 RepID=A0A1G8AK85_9ACTN|nr:hypothetical protein [Sinosporangium album]SDH21253.1 hypothetical protein SAMN05421505_112194 [Sinosporangium album]